MASNISMQLSLEDEEDIVAVDCGGGGDDGVVSGCCDCSDLLWSHALRMRMPECRSSMYSEPSISA